MPQNKTPTIGIDLMGGDLAPHELMHSIFSLAESLGNSAHFVLFGTDSLGSEMDTLLRRFSSMKDTLSFVTTGVPICMDDHPIKAVKEKKDSSMCSGMQMLKEQKIDAFISSGNTGALLSSAKLYLSTIKEVLRPALLAFLPTKKSPVAVLDVGANVSVKEEHLLQFALMGSFYQRCLGIKRPRIGLLNIGAEAQKGTHVMKRTYDLLEKNAKKASYEFVGNIEGKSAFEGNIDLLVTDGFTGNVFLKTAEGIANLVLEKLKATLNEEDFKEQMGDLKKHLHYADYPGALLIGVKGVVIKCHGDSLSSAFIAAIKSAISMIKTGLHRKILEENMIG